MKKAQQSQASHVWLTVEEVKAVTKHKSWNGVLSFAKRNNLSVNNETGKLLFLEHEVHEAMMKKSVRLGI